MYFFSRCWSPDRTLSQARKYIEETLGAIYADGVVLNLRDTWTESDPSTPLICFLSMGSDPTNNIETLAKALKLGKTSLRVYFCFQRFWLITSLKFSGIRLFSFVPIY